VNLRARDGVLEDGKNGLLPEAPQVFYELAHPGRNRRSEDTFAFSRLRAHVSVSRRGIGEWVALYALRSRLKAN